MTNEIFDPKADDCIVCKQYSLKPDFQLKHPMGHSLSWTKCQDCGFTFMNPRLCFDEMRKIYDSDEYWNNGSYVNYIENEPVRIKNSEYRLNYFSKFLPPTGTLLDVGCATGFFSFAASRRGYEVTGIDPSLRMIEYGKKNYGLDLRAQTIEEANFAPNSFDIISLWGTDSQFFDPRGSFSKLSCWLKPKGVFLFSYQNYASPIRWLFPRIKQRPNVYYNFSRKALHLFLRQLDLEIKLDRTAVQITQVHQVIRAIGIRSKQLRLIDNIRIKIPTFSYRVVVALKAE